LAIQDTGRRQTKLKQHNTICVGNCVNRDSDLLNRDNCYSTKTTPYNSQNNDKVYYLSYGNGYVVLEDISLKSALIV